jgi:hypothetical protein
VVRTFLPPVGRAQHHTDTTSSVRGAPASIMGRSSHGGYVTGLRPFALPRPDALSPLPPDVVRGLVSAYTNNLQTPPLPERVSSRSPGPWLYRGGAMRRYKPGRELRRTNFLSTTLQRTLQPAV